MEDVQTLIAENKRRNDVMFTGFNQITGKGFPGDRKNVQIAGFPIRKMYLPKKCLDNQLMKKVVKRGSIDNFLIFDLNMEANDKNRRECIYLICRVRAEEDPAFAFILFYKIKDKNTGVDIPFRLNYPQRLCLEKLESMRIARRPIRLIILKARQWGGSTESQLYCKWMQDFRHEGWNTAIIAHVKDASKRIKAMYSNALKNQPGWSLGANGEHLKFAPYESSNSDFIVTTDSGEEVKSSITSVTSYENYDALRSADLKCAHYSEVAYWKKTVGKEPEEVLSSIDGGIPFISDTIEILESSGRSAAGLFHDMYQEAKDENMASAYEAIFIAFYQIENDRLEVSDKEEFARWLITNKSNNNCPKGWRESGKFFWQLWQKGASFEAINWYRNRRNAYRSHTYIATEAPSDDVEAFRASGNLIFNMYSVESLRLNSKQADPIAIGNIVSKTEKGPEAITSAKFDEKVNDGQILKIWKFPDILKVSNRYVVSVDIGGRSLKSDYTVMTVIDRLGMIRGLGGKPRVVARWRGHIRHDLLAWKAAALAHIYQDALLVIESNTADTEKGKADTEGEHFGTIIQEIADYYPNLYIRGTAIDAVTQKTINKYGFQTNTLTKQYVIDNYNAYVDDQLYTEPDRGCFDEMMIYERREDGTIGNVPGPNNHDDIVMSTGIGLYVSQFEMAPPAFIRNQRKKTVLEHLGTEADM